MSEPEDMIVPMLRDMRDEMRQSFVAVQKQFEEVTGRLDRIEKRQETQREMFAGESVLARYAAKEVEERLTALEEKVAALEGRS